jgi:hypothetical protein
VDDAPKLLVIWASADRPNWAQQLKACQRAIDEAGLGITLKMPPPRVMTEIARAVPQSIRDRLSAIGHDPIEFILNYWNWFADLVNPYHDAINTISTIVIAAFAVVLARVAWKQPRDARILQRAYLNVKFGGIQSNSAGEL